VSSTKSAGLDPEKVLEIFKGLQKDGALAKIVSEDVAKKVPTNSSSELDKFLSSHTPVTLRLRAHLFHLLSVPPGGIPPGGRDGDGALIEDLQGDHDTAEAQDDAGARMHVLASAPLPDAAYVPPLTTAQRCHAGAESQRDHLIVLVEVLLRALADMVPSAGGAVGQAEGGADEAGAIRAALLRTREALVLSDSATRGKSGWVGFVDQSLAAAFSGVAGSQTAERLNKMAQELMAHVPAYKQLPPLSSPTAAKSPSVSKASARGGKGGGKGDVAAGAAVQDKVVADKLVGCSPSLRSVV
jgi:hypothetical protein